MRDRSVENVMDGRNSQMTMVLEPDTLVRATPEVASCALGEGAALLDLQNSKYYSLNPVAADLWDHLQVPATFGALVAHVREYYDSGDADVESDVAAVLRELADLNLVAVVTD